jgi:small acid-soluble spore protein D (minor alpha/beta-type SASP)
MSRSNKPVVPAAENALDRLKLEVASELGIAESVKNQGWATMTSADCGRVGGHMVRKIFEQYESNLGGSTGGKQTTGTLTAQYDANGKS